MEPRHAADTTDGRRRRRRVRWLVLPFLIIFISVLGVAGFYLGTAWNSLNNIKREPLMPPLTGIEGEERPPQSAEGSINYVLMGSDSRGAGDQGRSDVLMLAHVPPKHDKVYLISFPRDLWVTIPGRGQNKINAAYAFGGPPLTVRTLESLVGVRMDHAVRLDFSNFISLTEYTGPVQVDNKVASTSGDGRFTWPKGPIVIGGEEALVYVRQRYELPNGDLDRAERQRAVTKAIMLKLIDGGILADPVKFNQVMGEMSQYFVVDDTLTNETIVQTAASMKLTSGNDIRSFQVAISGFGRSKAGASIDVVDQAKLTELSNALKTGTVDDYYEKYKNLPLGPR